MASRKTVGIVVAFVLGSSFLCCVGVTGVGYLAFDRGFGLGYSPSDLRVEQRDGADRFVHPHLGFSILHPGASFSRDEAAEADSVAGNPLPMEAFILRDEESVLDLQILVQRLPILNESAARSARDSFEREVGDVFHHELERRGPRHWEAASFLLVHGETPMHVRMHAFEQAGKSYLVSLAASGLAPEELEPVLGSFRLRGGEPSGPYSLARARERVTAAGLRSVAISKGEPPPPAGPGFTLARVAGEAGPLAAYVGDDPGDGKRHPGLLWLHGGFGGIGEFCWEGYARPFIERGFVVMCPSTRGETDNGGRFELFLGEVDDARAAFEHLRALPYVDPSRVYVAGHSVGGTLTLLLAESTDGIRAAFSFGGAPDLVTSLGEDGTAYGFRTPYDHRDRWQSFVRSPLSFISSLRAPTYFFEGAEGTTTPDVAAAMERGAARSGAFFRGFVLDGHDHWSAVPPIAALVAERAVDDVGPGGRVELSTVDVLAALAAWQPAERDAAE